VNTNFTTKIINYTNFLILFFLLKKKWLSLLLLPHIITPNKYNRKNIRNSESNSFGNSLYSITFEDKENFSLFGSKYFFKLEDAIDDCPEYLVHFPTFIK